MRDARQARARARMRPVARGAALAAALALVASGAAATDGYFSHGYGIKAKARGGAAIAFADDAFGGANNPAAMAFAGDRLDLGLDLFSPRRKASRSGLGPGLDGSSRSDSNWFPVPEFGWSHAASDNFALGVTVYGNGGMNTDYPGGAFNCGQGEANMLCGVGALGVDLNQLLVAPTFAWSFAEGQALGISPLLAWQRFEARGLHAFAGTPGLSVAPDRVTNRGHDSSSGIGVRLGWQGHFGDALALGATWAPKIRMSRFSDYAGLFAGGGRFDIPENYGVGLAWAPAATFRVGLDWQRINYGGVPAIASPSTTPGQLGAAGGPGFGWRDVDVWKLGLEWRGGDAWTWRAGYNRSDNPVRAGDVTFNILAPGVVTDHVTFGFTRHFERGELSLAAMHAFRNTRSGTSILPAFMGGAPAGRETISMYQNSLGLQYEWRL